jgi:hypothetical protein
MKQFNQHRLFLIILIAIIIILGRHLNPFDGQMFTFHDESQVARVQQYTLNLIHFQIPPRIAPDFSFHLGFPVFNFYAPTAYIVTGLLHLVDLPVISALKVSFLLAIILAFVATYLFLNKYFKKDAALLGAILYVTCLYLPVDIFVRGNLAEVWFIALFPFALYGMTVISRKSVPPVYTIMTILIIHLLLTSHNILSLLAIPILGLYALLLPEKRKLYIVLGLSLLSTSYFFLPLIMEQGNTYATYVATLTKYSDHFLCINQLWQSPWGYGGSAPGCIADGMSFKLGKPQVLMSVLGLCMYVWILAKRNKRKEEKIILVVTGGFIILTGISLWMTTYQSEVVWNIFPFLRVVQFPWRFISLSMIGIAFLGAFGWSILKLPYKMLFTAALCLVLISAVSPYFYKEQLSSKEYMARYAYDTYTSDHVAYTVAEYLPRTADYNLWRYYEVRPFPYDTSLPAQSLNGIGFSVLRNKPFEKSIKAILSGTVALNIHYFPAWSITLNGNPYFPIQLDKMGRPVLNLTQGDEVHFSVTQSNTELVGDFITIGAILIAIYIFLFPDLWKKKRSLKT